jgi:hypothetical protein
VADKNFLLDYVRHDTDWVVMIDGDEVLTQPDNLVKAISTTASNGLALPVLYLWDREDQIRVDGVYADMSRVSAFRPGQARFEISGAAGFHCGNVPQSIRGRAIADSPLLHFGYLHREDRVRKFDWYNAQDPSNQHEDRYRHMVIGDVFPAESRFRHGGPLQLREIDVR